LSNQKYQALLDKLLLKVIKDLKKKMFPRKHVKLVYDSVDIAASEMEYPVIGQYASEEIKKFTYNHHIFISIGTIEDYMMAKPGVKLFYKNRIKSAIAHELIHAYVFEKYEGMFDMKNTHLDGSPIFLGILTYLNVPSGHKSGKSFKYTELYRRIKNCTKFEEVEDILLSTVLVYEKAFSELKCIFDNDNKAVYANMYEFGNGIITGLKGSITSAFYLDGYLCKANSFYVGANTDISKLKEHTLKKIYNNSFETKYQGKLECTTIHDKQEKLHLQSMNI
jgi:predicted Zn-dependent protease